jgi:transposase
MGSSDHAKIAAAEDYWGPIGLKEVAGRHGVNVVVAALGSRFVFMVPGVRTKTASLQRGFKLAVLQRMRSEKPCGRGRRLFNVRRHDMIGAWQRAYDSGGVAATFDGGISVRIDGRKSQKTNGQAKADRDKCLARASR